MTRTCKAGAKRIGFIGLGLLGLPMALRLLSEGFVVVGWNREQDRCDALISAGGHRAETPADVANECDVICLCLLDQTAVDAVVFGPDGVSHANSLRSRVVLDFSTLTPEQTRNNAQRAHKYNIRWVDAPVSGGPSAAQIGKLTVMTGGDLTSFAEIESILRSVAAQITHVGEVGSGQAMKAINQVLVGGTFVLIAEAMALTRQLGIDPKMVPTSLAGGLADSQALQKVWPRMESNEFNPPTGRASQLLKDLVNIQSTCLALNLNLPVIEAATDQYRRFVQNGHGNEETISISRLYASKKSTKYDQ